jgi:xanthine/CO dehydrogenase XdhC/CoxF family maturation factor
LATVTGCALHPALLGKTIPFENEDQWLRDFPVPELANTVLTDVQKGLKSGETHTLYYQSATAAELRICLEVLMPAIHLVMLGSNNDIYPLARIGKELGWDLTVMANPLKMDKTLFGMAKVLAPNDDQLPAIDAFTAVVLMSHDYKTDFRYLPAVLRSEAPYIGMLGPRKRAQKMFDALAEAGKPVSDLALARIFAPAGLDIGALTPEEIALSIAAEIRACFAGRMGTSLRLKTGTIH